MNLETILGLNLIMSLCDEYIIREDIVDALLHIIKYVSSVNINGNYDHISFNFIDSFGEVVRYKLISYKDIFTNYKKWKLS